MARLIQITAFVLAIIATGCKKNEVIPEEPWAVQIPSNFPATAFDLENRPFTKAGFELGRKLFYDTQLSRDNSTACGSCHISTSAFTHHGHTVSHGIDNLLGRRNSLPIQNMLWMSRYLWDGGVQNLELVSINAITSPFEMDETPANILEKLKKDPKYPPMFKAAYGSEEVTSTGFLFALAQFMGTLVSADSKYDHVMRGENGAVFTDSEQRGYDLFKAKCASCHQEPLFTDHSYRDNGLRKNYDRDKGRFEISLDSADLGKFRVPSLRNLGFTKPFMHDGKKASLESVLDHYASGIEASRNLDTVFKQANGQLGIPLTAGEKSDIIQFLKTLDDEAFVRNPAYSEQ